MTLTRELIFLASNNGGWNNSQLSLMGVNPIPPLKGWLDRLIGTEISDENWAKVMALSGVKKKLKRKEIVTGQQRFL